MGGGDIPWDEAIQYWRKRGVGPEQARQIAAINANKIIGAGTPITADKGLRAKMSPDEVADYEEFLQDQLKSHALTVSGGEVRLQRLGGVAVDQRPLAELEDPAALGNFELDYTLPREWASRLETELQRIETGPKEKMWDIRWGAWDWVFSTVQHFRLNKMWMALPDTRSSSDAIPEALCKASRGGKKYEYCDFRRLCTPDQIIELRGLRGTPDMSARYMSVAAVGGTFEHAWLEVYLAWTPEPRGPDEPPRSPRGGEAPRPAATPDGPPRPAATPDGPPGAGQDRAAAGSQPPPPSPQVGCIAYVFVFLSLSEHIAFCTVHFVIS